jgi:hypothetical protein
MSLDSAEARDRSTRRRVGAAWALLYFNTLTWIPGGLIHVPSHVGKGFSQGALPLALLVALTANPKIRLRPNVFLCLVGLLVVDTVITAVVTPHLGDAFRTARLAEFVIALWLLTPFWGRDDMLLLRCQLRCLYVTLGSVMLGFIIAHHRATAFNGRLEGVIWPMLPTQVAQYAAMAAGLTAVLWFARLLSGRATVTGVIFAVVILLLTHTSNARVRKIFATGVAVVSIGAISASGIVLSYLARGENAQGLTSLTGRTNFWALVLATPRTKFQEIFGFGLSNAGVDGLPIDSNWLAGYMQEGLFGVVVCAAILVWLFVTAFFQPSGVRRALTLFILTYCLIASFTEDSFTDVSTYLLHLTVAASLLIAPLVPREMFAGASAESRRP